MTGLELMRIEQLVSVQRPVDEVWRLLKDVPAVVACIPGAELGEQLSDGTYRGAFRVKVGALTARIEGEGRLQFDDAQRSGSIEGKGVDRRGGSRAAATMSFNVKEAPAGALIAVAAELTLAGPLSQIGRTGLIEDVAKRLTEDFSAALTARLATAAQPETQSGAAAGDHAVGTVTTAAPSASFDIGRAVRSSLWTRLCRWFNQLFGRRFAK